MHLDSLYDLLSHIIIALSAKSPLKQINADSVRAGELSWVARTKGQIKFLVLEESLWRSTPKQWGGCWKWHRCTQNREQEICGTQNNNQNYLLGPSGLPEIVKCHTITSFSPSPVYIIIIIINIIIMIVEPSWFAQWQFFTWVLQAKSPLILHRCFPIT